jgi:hypothetical protein
VLRTFAKLRWNALTTGHACRLYTGIYRGLARNQRRQAARDRETWWKQEVRAWRLLRQISRMIYFIDTLLYSVEEVKDWYGGRLFVTPLSHICIARVSQSQIRDIKQ